MVDKVSLILYCFSCYSIGLVQNVSSQYNKTISQTNSVAWNGKSSFAKFWLLDSRVGSQIESHLFEHILKTLTENNKAIKKLGNSDILGVAANLSFDIIETPDKLNSIVTLRLVLNTSAENQNRKKTTLTNADSDNQIPSKKANTQTASDKSINKPNKFDEMVLARHNMYRKKHKAPPLVYSKKLSDFSLEWAKKLAETNEFYHRPKNEYGENLYSAWFSDPKIQLQANAAVDSWYAEVKEYDYTIPRFSNKTGHFTQLVWKNSKELGIGVAKSKRNVYYVVCNYNPPGNFVGNFAENVLRPTKS